MSILEIDPGLSGALALIEDGMLVEEADIEAANSRINVAHLSALLQRCKLDFASCEMVAARPRQGAASTFTFGHVLGSITAALSVLGIPFLLIRPQIWQPYFKILTPSSEIYGPRMGLLDGRSDAIMIAHYTHDPLCKMPETCSGMLMHLK